MLSSIQYKNKLTDSLEEMFNSTEGNTFHYRITFPNNQLYYSCMTQTHVENLSGFAKAR